MSKTLRLILGDQLNIKHSWFREARTDVVFVLMEILPETAYTTHHIQKVAGFFAAMRQFAQDCREHGHEIVYLYLDDENNQQSFEANLQHLISEHQIERFEYMLPDEYRLDQQLATFCQALTIPSTIVDSEHFMTSRYAIRDLFANKKTYIMETFYRDIRRKTGILMEGKDPYSGRWNYDAENRKALPRMEYPPAPISFKHDVSDIVDMLRKMDVQTIGNIDAEDFPWPISRGEALQTLDFFLEYCLAKFGLYQDAMSTRSAFVYHSRLSFAMNIKLIHPREIVDATISYWRDHQDEIDIAQVEGFIRQIIGWREFMRGVYWAKMPQYESLNALNHQAKLPAFYWTGETGMNCLHHAITQSLDEAYAHHIQRLMVTGNFATLLGVHPDQVDDWYLGIYIDAIQWVEITNTRGMSQYADGGIVATKPYVSSANYINKMSDYCKSCRYDRKQRYGEDACPFNSLYWDFFDRHRETFANNMRVAMAYRHLNKMDHDELHKMREQAATYKKNSDSL